MGCFGSKDSQTKVTLKHLITRLRTSVPIQKGKIQRKLQTQQNLLAMQFAKPKKQRSKPIEQSLIEQIVYMKNMLNTIVWSVTDSCCTKVIDYYAVLEDQQNVKHIRKQIQILLFMDSILKNADLNKIYRIVVDRYKITEPKEIENQTANYHKHWANPNEKMKNQYIMNLCLTSQLQLAKINEAGHNFRYGV